MLKDIRGQRVENIPIFRTAHEKAGKFCWDSPDKKNIEGREGKSLTGILLTDK